jgi:hypothetical protein
MSDDRDLLTLKTTPFQYLHGARAGFLLPSRRTRTVRPLERRHRGEA